ncbi:MAG: twin-arginine translocation signal domain-containing protein [Gammaproteobacteria bacterium]
MKISEPGPFGCNPDESRRRFLRFAGLGTLGMAVASSRLHAADAEPASPPVPPRTGAEPSSHEHYMRRAIAMAKRALQFPFGAVIVQRATGVIVAEGHNRSAESPTFHGEIVVINR